MDTSALRAYETQWMEHIEEEVPAGFLIIEEKLIESDVIHDSWFRFGTILRHDGTSLCVQYNCTTF